MNELAKIETFRRDLALAETFDEIKLISDAGLAYAEFMKRQGIGKDGVNKIGKFLIEVDSKKGGWLNENYPSNKTSNQYLVGTEKEPSKMPATKKESAQARTIERTPEIVIQAVIEELESNDQFVLPKTVYKELQKREYKKKNDEIIKNNKDLKTDKKYRIFYADPPWSYGDKQETIKLGGASKHYPTMSIEQLCAMPIKEIKEKNAVLFIWVTSPLLEESFDVINAWGFKYKTSFVWDKIKHNMGHYNSVRHEFLLICTSGSCTPDHKKLFNSVQSIERSDKHSEKPEQFREIIKTLYTHGRSIELFSRVNTAGWDSFGNQL